MTTLQTNDLMRKVLSIFIFIAASGLISAQENRITLQLKQIVFDEFADTVEKIIPVKIFYSEKWVDSLSFDVNSENQPLDDILNKSLTGKGISFIITDDNKIILSKDYRIKTDFHKQYLAYLRRNQVKSDTLKYAKTIVTEETVVNDEYKVFTIGNPARRNDEGNAILTGVVTNSETGDPLSGVVVYVARLKTGAITNNAGWYSIELPRGQYQVEYRMVGMRNTIRNIIIHSGGNLDATMSESTNRLNEVVVSANRENIVQNLRMGVEKINVKMLKQIPMGMGEVDVFKSSLMLPGVTSVGEASSGYNIRGGSTDQNLILLNGAPIINPSHFFGFFSSFNSDIIGDVTLYKSGIPARFGGRVSSVMDISLAEGNAEKYNVSGGISPLTGRIMAEGPIVKNKSSFIVSARTTYSDWILGLMDNIQLQKSSAGFNDFLGMITLNPNEKNSYSISGYLSNDNFEYYRQSAITYSNFASTVRWKHVFNSKLSSVFSGIISNYGYSNSTNNDSTLYSTLNYTLDQKVAKADFSLRASDNHRLDFGLDAIAYTLMPGRQRPYGDYSEVTPKDLEKERALEPSLYISDEYEISSRLMISAGLRFTMFSSFGPETRFIYNENSPRSVHNIIDTIHYTSNRILNFYPGPEFRLSSRFVISPGFSIKAGIQRNYQYLHMISNTVSMTPTDIWKLSDKYIKPQRGDQFSFGMYKNFSSRGSEASMEVYYKNLRNILDYKGGAELLMNDHLETDIINGNGKAYGMEIMLKKQSGMLTGWISYTYSRVLLKVDGAFGEEKINNGNYFPANYDKPHDFKFVANARLYRRFNFTTNFVYSTGRPITYPVAYFNFMNVNRVFYSNRNEFRIPDYMRLDLAATLNGNLKAKKLNHSSLTFTVYNVLGRRNPYSIFFKVEEGAVKGYQMSIFGQPVFMLTYNFRIRGNASTDF